jgi:hypothetical protein
MPYANDDVFNNTEHMPYANDVGLSTCVILVSII